MTRKKVQTRPKGDPFSGVRSSFDRIVHQLSGNEAPQTHSDLEAMLRQESAELTRQLLQARLEVLFERERADLAAASLEPGTKIRVRERQLESEFGRVIVARHGLTAPGKKKPGF